MPSFDNICPSEPSHGRYSLVPNDGNKIPRLGILLFIKAELKYRRLVIVSSLKNCNCMHSDFLKDRIGLVDL